MKIIETQIPDLIVFEPKIFGDQRGYFFESYREDIIDQYIGKVRFNQDNQSKSSYGTLRGLHFQRPPFTQSKLVRCISGEVLDVAVDIRLGSPTYGKSVSVKLNDENQRQFWVPKGFAHGFIVLSESAIFAYKCDNYYAPEYDGGILWNDPSLGIDWLIPENEIILSDKDKKQPLMNLVDCFKFEFFEKHNIYK